MMFFKDNAEYNEWLDQLNKQPNVPPDEADQFVAEVSKRVEKGSWKALKSLLEVDGE
jgi:hypothetical protein